MGIRTIATLIGMVVGLFTVASTVAAVTWFVVDMRVAPLEKNVAAFRSESIVRFDRLETKYDARFEKYDARLAQLEATTRRLGESLAEMKGAFDAFVAILRESVGFDAPASSALSEGHFHQRAALESPCPQVGSRSSAAPAPQAPLMVGAPIM